MAAPKKKVTKKKTRRSAARTPASRTPRKKTAARKTVKKKAAKKKVAGKAARKKSRAAAYGAKARKIAASAAERLQPALQKAMESASDAMAALQKTAVSAGHAVERSQVASRPIARARSLISESLHRLQPRIKPLRLLILDVDGVLTDGGIFYTDGGEEMKRFDIHDGMAVDLLQRAGIEVGVLTGRRSEIVARRCRELGIRIVKQGFYDKSAGFEEILREESLAPQQVGYVGDDVQDLAVMKKAGFSAAPGTAVSEVQAGADYVTARNGGRGAVREVAELILTALERREEIIKEASAPGAQPPPGREEAVVS